MCVVLFGIETHGRCADLVLLAELHEFPYRELELGNLQTLLFCLQICASILNHRLG